MSEKVLKRYADAVAITAGACNPSGICHSLVEACHEIMFDNVDYQGTVNVTSDPAIRLMVYQLAYICGVIDGTGELANGMSYGASLDHCKAMLEKQKETGGACG